MGFRVWGIGWGCTLDSSVMVRVLLSPIEHLVQDSGFRRVAQVLGVQGYLTHMDHNRTQDVVLPGELLRKGPTRGSSGLFLGSYGGLGESHAVGSWRGLFLMSEVPL